MKGRKEDIDGKEKTNTVGRYGISCQRNQKRNRAMETFKRARRTRSILAGWLQYESSKKSYSLRKMKMRNLKEEYGLPLPDEYFAPLPPEVNNDYMANLTQKERVERLRQFGNKLTTKKTDYDSDQMSMI